MNQPALQLPRRRSRLGQISLVVIGGVVAIVLIVVAALTLRSAAGRDGSASGQADTFTVRRGGFDITIPVSGELAALKQIEIRNLLDGRSIITEIVSEGTFVRKGDVLFRLNDEEIRNKHKDAQDQVNVSENALKTAQANLAIKESTRDSDIEKADVQITLGELALQAWKEGADVSKRKELDLAIETAGKEYTRLVERFQDSERLKEQKFISEDEYKRDEIAMIQARAKIEQTKLDFQVYDKYQAVESLKRLESELKQSIAERQRVGQRSDAAVESAQSDLESKQYQLESAKQKLADLSQQLAYSTITAPADGLVVYFASTQTGGMGRNEGRPPQVGTELSRNELVIILPDTSVMVASVKISEALVGQIQPGQRATVTCDALPDRSFSGEVYSVGVMAESGGWRDPNRRDYTVKVRLHEGSDLGLKPSMRCKAAINVGRVEDALHIPVQAVFRSGPVAYVYVPDRAGYSQRRITTGPSSELFIQVNEGLTESEIVLLREPRSEEIYARIELPKDKERPENGDRVNGSTSSTPGGEQAIIGADPAAAGPPSDPGASENMSPGMPNVSGENDRPRGPGSGANGGSPQGGRRRGGGGQRPGGQPGEDRPSEQQPPAR